MRILHFLLIRASNGRLGLAHVQSSMHAHQPVLSKLVANIAQTQKLTNKHTVVDLNAEIKGGSGLKFLH